MRSDSKLHLSCCCDTLFLLDFSSPSHMKDTVVATDVLAKKLVLSSCVGMDLGAQPTVHAMIIYLDLLPSVW